MSLGSLTQFALVVLFWLLVLFPCFLYLQYHFRRQKVRIDKLLQTLQSLHLAEIYMHSHHNRDYPDWRRDEAKRDEKFQQIVQSDFRMGLTYLDYLVPVFIVTALSAIGWGEILGFGKTVDSLTHTSVAVPSAFLWGFVGAYFANLAMLIDKFVCYEMTPIAYHQMSLRIIFSTVAAYLLGTAVKDAFTPLIAFGIGLIPYGELWDTISRKTAVALGNTQAAGIPEEASLANIQGLEEARVREKLSELNISTVQALAMQDPLDLFFRTSFPLRTIVDWIDRAILYGYLGKKTSVLRERGINGAIEMGGLLELSEKLPVESYRDGVSVQEELKTDFKTLDMTKLYDDIGTAIGLKREELLNLIYNLYYDPMVDTLYELWGRN